MIDISTKKAVIFDLDGLLIDSEPSWDRGDKKFLEKHGIGYTKELRTTILGMGLADGIELFKRECGLQGVTKELMVERRSFFLAEFLKDPRLMDGAKDVVETAKRRGFALAIATGGNTVEKVYEILRRLGLDNSFSVVISSDEVEKGKPAPDVFLLTAKRLEVLPAECIVFEDAPNGVIAAKAAGMFAVGVNREESLKQRLKEVGADLVLSDLTQALPLFS
ncbi:MAG: HAD family phosphatase [bacterium]|nr:HAD family phosphatase [bacterium]